MRYIHEVPLMRLLILGAILALISNYIETSAEQTDRQRNSVPLTSPPFQTLPGRERKPNIILILTDDQDVELGSLNYMPKTLRAIRYQGAEFRHAYVTTPMCCPSRSSLLTGMYVHNHNVYTNNDNCSNTQWQTTFETRSFATYLSNAGYRTGYFGKYLNKYNGSYIPPGWREWGGLIMNSKYYNYSINMNGKKIKHGFDYYKDYYPDLIANDSIAFLRQSKKNSAHKPVMLTMSFPSPHGPEDSAPQYSHLFFNVTSHHIPSYDYAPNPDKQWILQVTKKMQPIHKDFTDLLMTKRLQTLQSVDSAVERVVDELQALGELHNTYLIYTSDHGYHLGQFGLLKGKSFPFEFDVRVPFLIRGPDIEPGAVIDEIILNIDLAPTFLDMAGVETPSHMDGRSILPLLNINRKKLKWPDTFLIESSGRREYPHLEAKLRKLSSTTPNIPSASTTDVTVQYDNSTNTSNIESNLESSSSVIYLNSSVTVPSTRLLHLGESEEASSTSHSNENYERVVEIIEEKHSNVVDNPILDDKNKIQLDNRVLPGFNPVWYPKFERLEKECMQPDMKQPCALGQKWFCEKVYGRWRKHKCKSLDMKAVPKNVYQKCTCYTGLGQIVHKNILSNTSLALEQYDNLDIRQNCSYEETRNNCTKPLNAQHQHRQQWLKSKSEINNQIHELQDKLDQLKLMRRKLKHFKPNDPYQQNFTNNFQSLGSHIFDKYWESHNDRQFDAKLHKKKHKRLKDLDFGNPVYKASKSRTLTVLKNASVMHIAKPIYHRHSHYRHQNVPLRNEEDLPPVINMKSKSTFAAKRHQKHEEETCKCEPIEGPIASERDTEKENRRKLKEYKLMRKQRKQKKKEQLTKECSSERMNCFHHDNNHWKTQPLWTNGPFCFCMNANNNTYSCVRTINSTHNFLYCEFTTGLITFYNLRTDPFELQNRVSQLKNDEKEFLHQTLNKLIACKGKSCTVSRSNVASRRIRPNISSLLHLGESNQKYRKGKVSEGFGGGLLTENSYHSGHGSRGLKKGNSRNITKTESTNHQLHSIRQERKLRNF